MVEYIVDKINYKNYIYYNVSRVEKDWIVVEREFKELFEVEAYITLKNGTIKEYNEYERA